MSHNLSHDLSIYTHLFWEAQSLQHQKKISKHIWCSPKGMWETPQTYGRRHSGEMRLKIELFGHQGKRYVWCKPNTSSPWDPHPHSEAWWWQNHAVGMFFHRQGLGNWSELKEMYGDKYREILEGKLFQSSRDLRLGRMFIFSKATTLSILLKQHSSGLRGNI